MSAPATVTAASIIQLARGHAPEAIQTLVDLLKSPLEKTRLMAAMVLLDRACGRVPPASTALYEGGEEDEPAQEAPRQAPRNATPAIIDAPAPQRSIPSAAEQRAARMKLLALIDRGSIDEVWTAPKAATAAGIPTNVASAMLVQLQRDEAIERIGAGMYKAMRSGTAQAAR